MLIDFTNPASIKAWIATAPEWHKAQLRGLYELWPMWRENILEAVK
jgi:hypothetical protein